MVLLVVANMTMMIDDRYWAGMKWLGVMKTHLGVEEGCLGRKACSTSLQVDEDESVLNISS